MAGPDKFEDMHLEDLSLEPMPDPNVLDYQLPKSAAAVPKPLTYSETRNKKVTDRRENPDRRKVLRFESDRRTGKDRRPRKFWETGKTV